MSEEKQKIGCFELDDECEDAEVIAEQINAKLSKLGLSAEAVISIMQPSGYAVTRIFYRKAQ